MATAITKGVKISVETNYHASHSNPARSEYIFAYTITIENQSLDTVQLLKRHWKIFDSVIQRDVKGDGVIGKQPILKPGESYTYVSGCMLKSEIGKMLGEYMMLRHRNSRVFKVAIPTFYMVVPSRLN